MNIRISGTANDSIVDGPGIRYTVFTQGCPHGCKGCHNPQTHDFNGGKVIDSSILIDEIKDNPLLDGVTFSGGEPFCQARVLSQMGRQIKQEGLNIVTYTGYLFEYLVKNANDQNGYMDLLKYTDILIDGRFEIEQRSIDALFKGSTNQRLIDCQKSLELNKVIEYVPG